MIGDVFVILVVVIRFSVYGVWVLGPELIVLYVPLVVGTLGVVVARVVVLYKVHLFVVRDRSWGFQRRGYPAFVHFCVICSGRVFGLPRIVISGVDITLGGIFRHFLTARLLGGAVTHVFILAARVRVQLPRFLHQDRLVQSFRLLASFSVPATL